MRWRSASALDAGLLEDVEDLPGAAHRDAEAVAKVDDGQAGFAGDEIEGSLGRWGGVRDSEDVGRAAAVGGHRAASLVARRTLV